MKTVKLMIFLSFIAITSACNKTESTQDKLFDAQRNVLDQAKQVGQKVDQQAQDLRQNVEKQSGN